MVLWQRLHGVQTNTLDNNYRVMSFFRPGRAPLFWPTSIGPWIIWDFRPDEFGKSLKIPWRCLEHVFVPIEFVTIYIIYIYIHIYDIHILVGKWCSGFKWLTTYGFIMFHWFLDQPQWDFRIFRRNWGCKKHDLRGLDVAWGKPFIGSKVRVLAEKMIRYDQITRITPQCSKQVQKWFSGQPGTFFF